MVYPSPYKYFKYTIAVTSQGNGKYTTKFASSNQNSVGPSYVYDNTQNGGTDSSAQLGDVSNDQYTVFFPVTGINDTNAVYLGETSSGGGFVGRYYAPNTKITYMYLYTNSKYRANQSFTIQNSPFAICYGAGTLIRTARGDVAVEQLAVGDLVVTASGAHRPIRWLGHRTVDCRKVRDPGANLPIRIAAHAIAENKPARDLWVSPAHSICVDVVGEILVPANALVNGSTIRQVEVDSVTYWHVELDSHDIILAENLAAESYIDMGNRGFFVESDVVDLAGCPDAACVVADVAFRPSWGHGAPSAVPARRAAKPAAPTVAA